MVKKGVIKDELTEPFYVLTDADDEFMDDVIELTETEAQWIEDTMKDWMLTQEFIEKKIGKLKFPNYHKSYIVVSDSLELATPEESV